MKKILITGASGFVGNQLLRKFRFKKDAVLYLIVNKNKILNNSKNINLIYCSLLNKKELKEKFEKINITDIIHCAWIGVDSKNRNSVNQKKNANIINNIFNALEKKKINSFIGIGSQAEYGFKKGIITEQAKLKPITFYGKTKVKVFNILKKKCKNKKIRFIWLRIFTGYGPGSKPEWLIPRTIQSLISKKRINFTAGDQIYNFIYISDIVKLIIKALYNKNSNGAYNVAYKKSYKIKNVIKLIFSMLKVDEKPMLGTINYRKDQIMEYKPSIKKLRKDFKWEPEIGIKEGLKKNINFLQELK